MDRPLEAIPPHALVPVEPGELGELTERHILTVAVEIFQVLLGQLVELCPDDGARHRIHGAAALVYGLPLLQEGHLSRSRGPCTWHAVSLGVRRAGSVTRSVRRIFQLAS